MRLRGGSTSRALFSHLSRMQAWRGDVERALGTIDTWARAHPHDGEPAHMRASLTQQNVPARASDASVVSLFDDFSSSFDELLASLRYVGHDISARALADSLAGTRAARVLDAGCGTGLAGPLLRPLANEIWGVDLSPKMLEKARERGIYDRLEVAELTSYLLDGGSRFDAILSADTIVYFGELEALFGGVARSLVPGGRFVFTVEHLDSGTFELRSSGRYAHSEAFVASALTAHGLLLERSERVSTRLEYGVPVPGLVAVARRS